MSLQQWFKNGQATSSPHVIFTWFIYLYF